jgi:hypothetical protein
MDYEKAHAHLEDYLDHLSQCERTPAFSQERRKALGKLNTLAWSVNSILSNLTPDHGRISGTSMNSHKTAKMTVARAAHLIDASLRTMEEPGLPIEAFEGIIAGTARKHWDAGRYRNAVSDAATRVNSYTQQRIGRYDISDKALMAEAFSEKPPEPGAPRLWCPENKTSLTVRSQQEGAKLFAMGAFAAIRNPAHHLTGEWLPAIAFEYLAAFSIVARWVRCWDVVCHPDDVTDFFRQQPKRFSRSGEEPRFVLVASADNPGTVRTASTTPKSKSC